jgi:dTDP-4-amino-4,6-dideoxygalactose transaminase
MIKVSSLIIDDAEEALVLEVLRSGRLAQGPMVARFEEAVRGVTGTAHAVAVSNGTEALMLALRVLDVGPGDEVVLPAFTFVATLNAVLHSGATPRFVDIGEDRCLDPAALADAIGPRTRAVLPVHIYGLPADMDAVRDAIGDRHVAVVEDSAQAIGARYGERATGSLGLMGCFSFYATKNITTGEGGAITTDDDGLAARLRMLRNQGQGDRYLYEEPGFNARMTDLQAAVGVAQMGRFDRIVEARRRNAAVLTEGLTGIEGLGLPAEPAGRVHVYHHYAVRVGPSARRTRDQVVEALHEAGVEAGTHYPRAVYDYDCFKAHPRVGEVRMPEAEALAAEVVSLPVHPSLSEADLAAIVGAVRAVLG